MWMRNTPVLLAAFLIAGCAGGAMPDSPAPFDPAGDYTIRTTVQGTDVTGRMQIRGEPGDYTGYVYTDMTGRLDFRSFELDGMEADLTVDSPDGPIYIDLTFHGEGTLMGRWTLGMEGGRIEGRRVQD